MKKESAKYKISPKGKRKLDFPLKHKKTSSVKLPLIGKTVFLDVKELKHQKRLHADLKRLGATLEEFVSKDIDYFITTQPHPRTKKDGKDAGPAPSPFSCDPSPSPGNVDESRVPTVTRGKALAEKARVKSRETNSLLDNAEKWGIKIVSLETAFKWIDKELRKLPKLVQNIDKGHPKPKCIAKYKLLESPFLKLESSNMHYRPFSQHLDVWPRLNVYTPRGSCPFDGTLLRGESKEERGEILGAQVDILSDDTPQEEKDGIDSNTPKPFMEKSTKKSETEGLGSCKILTAGELKRKKELKRRQDRKKGYCECCKIKYDDLDKHVREENHRLYVKEKSNFQPLDLLIGSVQSTAEFLQRCIMVSVTQRNQTDKNNIRNSKDGNLKSPRKGKADKHSHRGKKTPLKQTSEEAVEQKISLSENKSNDMKESIQICSTYSNLALNKLSETKENKLLVPRKSPRKSVQTIDLARLKPANDSLKSALQISPVKSNLNQSRSPLKSSRPLKESPLKSKVLQSPLKPSRSLKESPMKSKVMQSLSPLKSSRSLKESPMKLKVMQSLSPLKQSRSLKESPMKSKVMQSLSPTKSETSPMSTTASQPESLQKSQLRSPSAVLKSPLKSTHSLQKMPLNAVCNLRQSPRKTTNPFKTSQDCEIKPSCSRIITSDKRNADFSPKKLAELSSSKNVKRTINVVESLDIISSSNEKYNNDDDASTDSVKQAKFESKSVSKGLASHSCEKEIVQKVVESLLSYSKDRTKRSGSSDDFEVSFVRSLGDLNKTMNSKDRIDSEINVGKESDNGVPPTSSEIQLIEEGKENDSDIEDDGESEIQFKEQKKENDSYNEEDSESEIQFKEHEKENISDDDDSEIENPEKDKSSDNVDESVGEQGEDRTLDNSTTDKASCRKSICRQSSQRKRKEDTESHAQRGEVKETDDGSNTVDTGVSGSYSGFNSDIPSDFQSYGPEGERLMFSKSLADRIKERGKRGGSVDSYNLNTISQNMMRTRSDSFSSTVSGGANKTERKDTAKKILSPKQGKTKSKTSASVASQKICSKYRNKRNANHERHLPPSGYQGDDERDAKQGKIQMKAPSRRAPRKMFWYYEPESEGSSTTCDEGKLKSLPKEVRILQNAWNDVTDSSDNNSSRKLRRKVTDVSKNKVECVNNVSTGTIKSTQTVRIESNELGRLGSSRKLPRKRVDFKRESHDRFSKRKVHTNSINIKTRKQTLGDDHDASLRNNSRISYKAYFQYSSSSDSEQSFDTERMSENCRNGSVETNHKKDDESDVSDEDVEGNESNETDEEDRFNDKSTQKSKTGQRKIYWEYVIEDENNSEEENVPKELQHLKSFWNNPNDVKNMDLGRKSRSGFVSPSIDEISDNDYTKDMSKKLNKKSSKTVSNVTKNGKTMEVEKRKEEDNILAKKAKSSSNRRADRFWEYVIETESEDNQELVDETIPKNVRNLKSSWNNLDAVKDMDYRRRSRLSANSARDREGKRNVSSTQVQHKVDEDSQNVTKQKKSVERNDHKGAARGCSEDKSDKTKQKSSNEVKKDVNVKSTASDLETEMIVQDKTRKRASRCKFWKYVIESEEEEEQTSENVPKEVLLLKSTWNGLIDLKNPPQRRSASRTYPDLTKSIDQYRTNENEHITINTERSNPKKSKDTFELVPFGSKVNKKIKTNNPQMDSIKYSSEKDSVCDGKAGKSSHSKKRKKFWDYQPITSPEKDKVVVDKNLPKELRFLKDPWSESITQNIDSLPRRRINNSKTFLNQVKMAEKNVKQASSLHVGKEKIAACEQSVANQAENNESERKTKKNCENFSVKSSLIHSNMALLTEETNCEKSPLKSTLIHSNNDVMVVDIGSSSPVFKNSPACEQSEIQRKRVNISNSFQEIICTQTDKRVDSAHSQNKYTTPEKAMDLNTSTPQSGYCTSSRKRGRKQWKRKTGESFSGNSCDRSSPSEQQSKRRKLEKLKYRIEEKTDSSLTKGLTSPRKSVLSPNKNSTQSPRKLTFLSDLNKQSVQEESKLNHNEAATTECGINDSVSLKWQPVTLNSSICEETKKVKLNKSWTLISDRSASRLLSSENDADSFNGFNDEDEEKNHSLPSDMSYEEHSEVDINSSEHEWTVENESSGNDQEFSKFVPSFSSPGKQSEPDWELNIDSFMKTRVSDKNQSCLSVTSPWRSPRRSTQKRESSITDKVTPVKKKGQSFLHRINESTDREKADREVVDEDIEFNHRSPQKFRSDFSPLRAENGVIFGQVRKNVTSTPSENGKSKRKLDTSYSGLVFSYNDDSMNSDSGSNIQSPSQAYRILKKKSDVKKSFSLKYDASPPGKSKKHKVKT